MNIHQSTKRLFLKGSVGLAFAAGLSPFVRAESSEPHGLSNNTDKLNSMLNKNKLSEFNDNYHEIISRIK